MDQPVLGSVTSGVTGWTQSFTYDAAGRMRTNSRVGTYAYANPTVARHAPSSVTPATGGAQAFTYDANGNMLTGLDAKVMTYDGENRPVSVTFAGKKTCYAYGADGARLKKLEGYTGANCATPLSGASVTVYLGPAEVRKFGQGAAEQLILYPTPEVRIVRKIVSGSVTTEVTGLHRDGPGSVRAVTAGTGMRTETSSYRPYGEQSEGVYALNVPEARGYVGERLDADAGLQYLNARYYDPKLGMFVQPDWWEVTEAGVGTNRYSYSFGDPINGRDPTGHACDVMGACGLMGEDIPGFDWDPTKNYLTVAGMAGGGLLALGVAVEAPAAILTGAVLDLQAAADGLPFGSGKGLRIGKWSYAQKTFREEFSARGVEEFSRMAGRQVRTIDDLASAIRSGEISTGSITVEVVTRKGVDYILNTRTAQALERAGIAKKRWKIVDKTGDELAERRLDGQLSRNKMSAGDIETKPSSGGTGGGSRKGLGSAIRDFVRSIFGG